jgi:LPXTG-motif cell wall-anchored protein
MIMKKVILMCSMAGALLLGNFSMAVAQETSEKKDTISADTADPVYYKAEEEAAEKGGSGKTIAIIAGVVVVAAAGGYFLLKKKK